LIHRKTRNDGIKLWHTTLTRNDGIKLWHTTLTRNDGIKLWHTTLCINHGFDSGPKNKLYVIYRNGLKNMSNTNVKEIKS